jgi:uncharacterized protein YhaN
MKKASYILKLIDIYKMPGFPKGMDTLKDLSPNINIVAGPNASGKSSTARIIQQIIWRKKKEGTYLAGSVELDNETWEIKLDLNTASTQRNGSEDEITGIPPIEGQNRYLLSLHDLIKDNEDDLAKEIAKQSIGGFDLKAASSNLNYKSAINTKGLSEFKAHQEAEKKFKELRKDQKALKNREENLIQLQNNKVTIEHAVKLVQFYETAKKYIEARTAYGHLDGQMGNYPQGLKKLTGEEYIQINEFEKQIENAEKSIGNSQTEIEHNNEILGSLTIPENGVSAKDISELEERINNLKSLTNKIADLKIQIKGLETKEKEAIKSIDDNIDPTGWNGLQLKDITGLDKLLQDTQSVAGGIKYLNAEIEELNREKENLGNNLPDSDKLKLGADVLSKWLKEESGTSGTPKWVVVVAVVLGIITAVATYFFGWPGLLGIIFISVTLLFIKQSDQKQSPHSVREDDFINLELSPPSSWTTEKVAERLDELIRSMSEVKDAERIENKLETCQEKLDSELKPRLQKLSNEHEEWANKIKGTPGFPEENSDDFSSLYWFITNVKKWLDAHADLESWKAQNSELAGQYDTELESVNKLLEASESERALDASNSHALFIELKRQEEVRKDTAQQIKMGNKEIKEKEEQKVKSVDKLSELYQKLGINKGDKEEVKQLVDQLEDYKQLEKQHFSSKHSLDEKKTSLEENSLYQTLQNEIDALSTDQVQERLEDAQAKASGLDGVKDEITRIETLIENKKKGHELEDALKNREEALAQLEKSFHENLSSRTGHQLIEGLKHKTQEQNRPKVFKRANEIFNKITYGRYELRLREKDPPSFEAFDTVSRSWQKLSEISTGTRVQLLLSVRLAYVETIENSIKIPLLADELLANSDDERAKAIIEALIQISREGRQVFYFTAQADEVAKWKAHLTKQTDLDYKVIQLQGNDNNLALADYDDFQPDLDSLTLIHTVPLPNNSSHEEYRQKLHVQPFNILLQESSEIELWYLTEDLNLLYNLLRIGIKHWGQLKSYVNNDGKVEGLSREAIQQFDDKIKLTVQFQKWYRIGRNQPIDGEVLRASGHITPAFTESINNKLNELHGDPENLIQALKNGDVQRFRQANAETLEQYLQDEGYLDYEEPMHMDDILVQLQAKISNMNLDTKDLERYFNRVLRHRNVDSDSEV